MAEAILRVLNEEFRVACAPEETRRLEDLASALEARLAGFQGDVAAQRRLVLTALSLLDEAQAVGAALARAHGEIERLQDLIVDAHIEPESPNLPADDVGRTSSLKRVAQGAA